MSITTTSASTTAAVATNPNPNTINNSTPKSNDSNSVIPDDTTCHEFCSTPSHTAQALLNDNEIMATTDDSLLQAAAITLKYLFWPSPATFITQQQQQALLVKDDVFFAPHHPTTSSTMLFLDQQEMPTPCLSPVTSPSDFLYDREPLFDGIDQDYNNEPAATADSCTAVVTKEDYVSLHNGGVDLDWSALVNHYDFLPPTPSTTVSSEEEEEEEELGLKQEKKKHMIEKSIFAYDREDDYEEEMDSDVSDNEDYESVVRKKKITTLVKNQTIKKFSKTPCLIRKRPGKQESQQTINKKIKPTTAAIVSAPIVSAPPCATTSINVFEHLTQSGIDWCRYCGTTEGVNWRPGPWGKRTLCNKHGCDYKGYGLASRLPRLDLSAFTKEKLVDRKRPIVQQFCVICQTPEKSKQEKLISCHGGCSRAYHPQCFSTKKEDVWYCNMDCLENKQKNKVVVDLPRKYLPLMQLTYEQQKKLLMQQ